MAAPNIMFIDTGSDIERRYRALSRDSKYGHFVRIPRRICRCLDYFGVAANRAEVIERLQAYYLFIGVVDELIDSTRIETGKEILRQLSNRQPSFDEANVNSPAALVTEFLKTHIDDSVYARVLVKFEELYQAVLGERCADTVADFIEERKTVGRLTAELSYLLITPLLDRHDVKLRGFLMDVGEVGCLVDSLIDLRADREQHILNFNLTLAARFSIVAKTLRQGIKLSFSHPRLNVLFVEAVGDNLLDRLRSAFGKKRTPVPSETSQRDTSAEALSAMAWIKP